MSRTRSVLVVLVVLVAPLSAAGQEGPPPAPAEAPPPPVVEAAPAAPPPAVVVEAGTPVPVPLEGVAERLRAELGEVPVAVGPRASGAASVTLGLTADGRLHVVYRDGAGREASRIVADTGDPQAVAAAIAMVVANLHRSQMDAALAAIGPAVAPSPPPPPPVAAPPAVPAAPPPPVVAPAPPRIVVATVRRPTVAARTAVTPAEPSRWALWVAPTADTLGDWLPGLEIGGELRFGAFRAEVALSHAVPTYVAGSYGPYGWYEAQYSHTLGVVRVRRLVAWGDRVTLGAGVGLGFVISELSDTLAYDVDGSFDTGAYGGGDRSDLDALVSAGASVDIRLIGQTLFWTTRLEAILTTASPGDYRPIAPDAFGHLGTGLRLAL